MQMLSLTTVSDFFPPKANLKIILKEHFSTTTYIIATVSRKSTGLFQGQKLPFSKSQLNLPILPFSLPFKTILEMMLLFCFLTWVQQIFTTLRCNQQNCAKSRDRLWSILWVGVRARARGESEGSPSKPATATGPCTLLHQLTVPPGQISF